MGADRFSLSSINPNDAIGGGGCLCSPIKNEDCKGPYAIFYATETDSNLSPHCVLSLECAQAVVRQARVAVKSGELLAAGEADAPNPVEEESL